MRHYLFILSAPLLLFICISCGSTQQISKKELHNRITVLELENKNLKKDMQIMKSQVRILINNLPKPGSDAGAGGRPNNSGDVQFSENLAVIEFDNSNHDFGSIAAGASVTHTFKFKNTGNAPLIISNAKGSCGCTVPKWPKAPVAAGETGEIQVTFNSKGKKGNQHKSVTLTANTTPANSRIYIKASIRE
jgi:hypothetical protein